jgi:hypothetical protein
VVVFFGVTTNTHPTLPPQTLVFCAAQPKGGSGTTFEQARFATHDLPFISLEYSPDQMVK